MTMAQRHNPSEQPDRVRQAGGSAGREYSPFGASADPAGYGGQPSYGQGYIPGAYDPAVHDNYYPDHKPSWTDSFPHSFTGWGPQTPDYGHDHPDANFRAQLHFDDDYLMWRAEQMRKLDEDYIAWRTERHAKFNEDFNTWRASRPAAGAPANDASKPKG